MKLVGTAIGVGILAGAITLAVASAQAAVVNASLEGMITAGSDPFQIFGTGGADLAGQAIGVSFSYDTATAGAGGVFTGGANFLNPLITINSVSLELSDHLAPTPPTSITLVDGTPDSFAVDYAINATETFVFGGFTSFVDKLESLTLDLIGTADFLSGVDVLPSSLTAIGVGSGAFGFFYLNECLLYGCPISFVSGGAAFTFDRLVVGDGETPPPALVVAPLPDLLGVMEPGSLGMVGLGLLGLGALSRRRFRWGSRSFAASGT